MSESVLIYCTSGGLASGWELEPRQYIEARDAAEPIGFSAIRPVQSARTPLQNAIDPFSLLSQVAESTERARPRGSRWRRSCSVR